MIKLKNVSISFPILNSQTNSLKIAVLSPLLGGKITKNQNRISVEALKEITLSINNGDKIAVVGHNGSGKTTLLRTLSGIYPPTMGHISIEGKVNSLTDINLGINDEFTGRENIIIRAHILGIKKQDILNFQNDVINFSELHDFIDLPFRTYSSGMRIRLAFAIATYMSQDILIMDEWLSTGDSYFQEKANQRLSERINNSNIFIFASHSMNLVLKYCNRAIVLNKGKLIADDLPERVINKFFS